MGYVKEIIYNGVPLSDKYTIYSQFRYQVYCAIFKAGSFILDICML